MLLKVPNTIAFFEAFLTSSVDSVGVKVLNADANTWSFKYPIVASPAGLNVTCTSTQKKGKDTVRGECCATNR